MLAVALTLSALAADVRAAQPETPPPGMGLYVMVLWPPGTPAPGDPTGKIKNHPEPDVTKFGGRLLQQKDSRRLLLLPLGKSKDLRKDPAVVALQRIWMGESLENWDESAASSAGGLAPKALSDEDLQWGPKAYGYDGSGNIKQIGADQYRYDTAGRLISATVGSKTQTFKYDSFGNLTEMAVQDGTPVAIPVDGQSNRLVGQSYDEAGNVTSANDGRRQYKYDGLSMLTWVAPVLGGGDARRMVYDAGDERIGIMVQNNSSWRWMIRDFEGHVLREFKADHIGESFIWYWEQDYFYANGSLLGGVTQEFGDGTEPYRFGGVRHYHLDHLGSVRMVTESGGQRARSISENDYFPFGTTTTKTYQEELNWGDIHVDPMRYAGHERDFLGVLNVDNTDYLDYMHARYYSPVQGRFLSADSNFADDAVLRPQKWNRYSYVQNNPLRYVDPDGRSGWDTVNGYFNALFSDALLPVPRRTGNRDFQVGQYNGDRAAAAAGGILATTGAVTAVGGSETVVLAIVGGLTAVYGGAVAANASIHLAQNNRPSSSDSSDRPQYKEPKPGTSGRDGAKDIPSWAQGQRPKVGESGKDFAKRLLDQKYGQGKWEGTGPTSEYNKLKKYAGRSFVDPKPTQ